MLGGAYLGPGITTLSALSSSGFGGRPGSSMLIAPSDGAFASMPSNSAIVMRPLMFSGPWTVVLGGAMSALVRQDAEQGEKKKREKRKMCQLEKYGVYNIFFQLAE
jgi:hypothetical protein